MAKEKMTVTLDPGTLAQVDTDARTAGLNRSEYVERALRNEHYRRQLAHVDVPAPTADTDARFLRDVLAWQSDPYDERPKPAS